MSKKVDSNKENILTANSSEKKNNAQKKLSEQWQNINTDGIQSLKLNSYNTLLQYVKDKFPSKVLTDSIHIFDVELTALADAQNHARAVFADQPIIIAFLIWSKHCYIKIDPFDYPKIIVEKKLIPFQKETGRLILIKQINKAILLDALESIRCRKDLDIHLKEALVYTFLDFNEWFCNKTSFADSLRIEDPDKIKTKGRALEFDDFIALLCALDKRSQLVAKLLYFGGSRTLDQVIKLQVEDVLFDNQAIIFDDIQIAYPKHIFEDILFLINGRNSGNVFEGRQNAPLNAATIFRNFKEAVSGTHLEDSFSPKTLTTNL